jgi:hypothetical protein
MMNCDDFTSEELDDKTPMVYANQIEYEHTAGGNLELKLLSNYYKTNIWIFDYTTGELKTRYLSGEDYENNIYLKTNGEKWSIIVGNSSDKFDPREDLRVFPSEDSSVKYRIINSIQEINELALRPSLEKKRSKTDD